MITIFKNKGFRNFIIRTVIFVALVLLIMLGIQFVLRSTQFYKVYLTIPKEFYLDNVTIRLNFTNSLLFTIVAFIIMSYNDLIKFKKYKIKHHQILFGVLAFLVLVGQYLFIFIINQDTKYFLQSPILWGLIKIIISILFIVLLGISIYGLDLLKQFFKEFKQKIILAIILFLVFFAILFIIQNLWTLFSALISTILHNIFLLFFTDVTYKPYVISFTMLEGGGPLIGINNFSAIIGKPCSGIDSFLLFTSLYALIMILDYKKLKKGWTFTMFFIGIIGMFITNIIRIFLLYLVGVYISPSFAVGMFHTNVGWILFIIYFFIFWWIVSKYIYKKAVRGMRSK